MKVKDLILRLQECNPNHLVVVDGYEGGVTELRNIQDEVEISMNVNTAYYYGEHEVATPDFSPQGRKGARCISTEVTI